MAAKAKLSILGLYRWNNHIFDDINLPEEIDHETVIWQILETCAELEILYPDADYMQLSIGHWSAAMLPNWQRIVDALIAEYNPVWNKDGKISETFEHGKREHTDEHGQQEDATTYGEQERTLEYGEDEVSNTIGERSQTATHSVTGFNASTFENAEQDLAESEEATDTSTREARTDTDTLAERTDTTTKEAYTDTHTEDAYTDKRTVIEQGNIGVTESSAMVRHEVELRQEFNIYQIIADDFKRKYCLMVY